MLIILLAAVLTVKTIIHPFAPGNAGKQAATEVSLPEAALQRLAQAIRIPTVSQYATLDVNNPFDAFKAYLPQAFPHVHAGMDTLSINKYGLVYRWPGADANRKPILFLAHYDVVPVAGHDPLAEPLAETDIIFRPDDRPRQPITAFQSEWDYAPFSGTVAHGRIYGRGALDDKSMLMALFEAADTLMAQGFVPQQDIWFAFGHDEEIGGTEGALKIAEHFKQKGIGFETIYDEGSIIVAPGQAGINRPTALVGIAEKGECTLRITVHGMGGHASMPGTDNPLVQAAEIIKKLNDQPLPARITPPVAAFLDRAGADMPFAARMVIANQWLLKPLLLNTLAGNPATNALVRTTTAVTMAKGSDAPNVIGSTAQITANFRVLAGETADAVVKHVTDLCADYQTEIEVLSAREPSNTSPTNTPGFEAIVTQVPLLFQDADVTAYVSVVSTDAYKYESLSPNVYRFMPALLNEYEQRTIHNENEYISTENYVRMIAYFKNLMNNYAK